MALKKDVLVANASLATLTAEQISAIETLSANDENTVIAEKVREIHTKYDETILQATGIPRDGHEKSYDYAARAGKILKDQLSGMPEIQKKISDLEAEKNRLETALANNSGDAETKRQLQQAQTDLEATKKMYNAANEKVSALEKEHSSAILNLSINNEVSQLKAGLKFKEGLPQAAIDNLFNQEVSKLTTIYKPAQIDDGNGGKRIVFRNEAGETLNNAENQLMPFTASELVKKSLNDMGLLSDGKQAKGGGSGGNGAGSGGGSSSLDLSGAKNRVEANSMIKEHLNAQGLSIGTKEYQDAMNAAYIENKVGEMPLQ